MKLTDEQLEDIITTIEENLDYEDYCNHADNCEIYAYVENRDKVKEYIKEILKVK